MRTSTTSSSTPLEQAVLTAAKGGGITFAGTLFAYAVRFVLGIVLARFLGAEQFGLYDLTLTTIVVGASLVTFGLGQALVRYVSVFVSRQDAKGLWGALQIGLGLPTILSVLIGIGLYALATPVAERLFDEPRLVPLLRLASLALPFLTLSNIMAAATRGFKKMQYSVIAQEISHSIIKLILIVMLAIIGLNAARAVAAHVLTLAIVSVMLLYFLNNLFSLKRPLRTARRDTREMFKFALPVYLSGLIVAFRGSLQTILLGSLHTFTSVGIFAVVSRVTMIGTMINNAVFIPSMPIVSELYELGKMEQLGHFYQTMTKWAFTLNLPLFLVVVLFPNPILSIFGQSFAGGATVFAMLAGASLVRAGDGMCGVLIDMTGNPGLQTVNGIVLTVLMFGFNLLLIPSWGMVGAAWVTLGHAAILGLIRLLEVFVLFRLLPYNVSFVKPVTAGVVALGVGMAINKLLPPEASPFYIATNVAVLLAAYIGMILLLGLSREDRIVLARVGRRVNAMLSK